MKRLQSRKDCKGYTLMKQLLINLELESSDYNWLITDIEAYPQSKEIFEIINNKEYIILSTKELTILLKAEPIMTPTAISITFPFDMNSLNSFNIFFIFINPFYFYLIIL